MPREPLLNTTTFTGSACSRAVSSSPSSIDSPPSPDMEMTWRPGKAVARPSLRQRVGHGPVAEEADDPPARGRGEVARGPNVAHAGVDGEDGVLVGEVVELR